MLLEWCQWLNDLPLSQQLRESEWAFPYLLITHVIGLTLAGGSIAYLDLRLLGFALTRTPFSQIAANLLKAMWLGWALMLISGSFIFLSEAVTLYNSAFFRAKLVMMLLAGINALIFHNTIFKRVADWDLLQPAPTQARITGAISLLLWMGMVAAGRFIPYYASY